MVALLRGLLVMFVYAIRQKSTGLFIPRLEPSKRRGGSFLEPSDEREPRFFPSKISARNTLSNWLKGHHVTKYMEYDGGEESYTDTVFQPHRKKEDMEIVEFELVEKGVL